MKQSQDRVAKQHPGTGVPHRLPNPLLHILSIAVSGTLNAGGLAFLIGTLLKALQSIGPQFLALGAEFYSLSVDIPAIPLDHNLDRPCFPENSGSLGHPLRHPIYMNQSSLPEPSGIE